MSKEEKLKKIIEFAVSRGWNRLVGAQWEIKKLGRGYKLIMFNDDGIASNEFPSILFSHDFAKAVFGEEPVFLVEQSVRKQKHLRSWQFHLQQAVISKDPINYYYKYVKTKEDKRR